MSLAVFEKHVRIMDSVDVHVEEHYDPETEETETFVVFKMDTETILRLPWNDWTTIVSFVEQAHAFEY
jgi:hypothetical protein